MESTHWARREWLQTAGTVAAAWAFSSSGRGAEEEVGREHPFLLSTTGCGRATGYAESNKIVTSGDKTHVAWLDSPKEGFRVRIRTLDRATGKWSPTYTVGEAFDNHGGPALTIDSEGFLHIVYHPHHHAMRYRRSTRPNDASAWEDEIRFGERLTYPTLVCGKDDSLFVTARRSFTDRPWQVELWQRPRGGGWRRVRALLRSRHRGYAHFQESLAWGPDHRTLHLACRFHEKSDRTGYGRLQAVAYLVSPDLGKTWQRSDGTRVTLPATAESAEVLARGGVDQGKVLRVGGLAVDAGGRAHLVYSVEEKGRGRTLLARPRGDGKWQRIDLRRFLPKEWASWDLVMPGGVTFAGGGMIVTATARKAKADESAWGHPSSEVVQFRSGDGGATFRFAVVSRPDPATAHWLPSLERPTGHHAVPSPPGILYTAGGPGRENTELLSNKVFFTQAMR